MNTSFIWLGIFFGVIHRCRRMKLFNLSDSKASWLFEIILICHRQGFLKGPTFFTWRILLGHTLALDLGGISRRGFKFGGNQTFFGWPVQTFTAFKTNFMQTPFVYLLVFPKNVQNVFCPNGIISGEKLL